MYAGKTFLIVEDEQFTRLLLVRHLRSTASHEALDEPRIVSASDGKAALEELKSGVVDVVFADLHMPQIDGLALLRAVRSGEAGVRPDLPFVIVTGDRNEAPREAALTLKVNSYLFKPLTRNDVKKFIEETLPGIVGTPWHPGPAH